MQIDADSAPSKMTGQNSISRQTTSRPWRRNPVPKNGSPSSFDELLSSVAQKNESVRKEKHSVSTRIRFSQKKLTHMSKTFKKEFIANGLAAHVIKRPSGKTGFYYEIRYRRNGYNLTASAKNIKDAKQKFLKMTEPGEIEKYQAKQEKTGLYLLDEIAAEWLKHKARESCSADVELL